MLRQRAEIIDADRVYRSLLIPESELWRRSLSGSARPSSSQTVRSTAPHWRDGLHRPEALADLDRITHPAVIAEIRSRIAQSSAPLIVVEAVKLVQSVLPRMSTPCG